MLEKMAGHCRLVGDVWMMCGAMQAGGGGPVELACLCLPADERTCLQQYSRAVAPSPLLGDEFLG